MDRLEHMCMFDNGLSNYNGVKVLSVYCHMNGRGPQRVRELNFDGMFWFFDVIPHVVILYNFKRKIVDQFRVTTIIST